MTKKTRSEVMLEAADNYISKLRGSAIEATEFARVATARWEAAREVRDALVSALEKCTQYKKDETHG